MRTHPQKRRFKTPHSKFGLTPSFVRRSTRSNGFVRAIFRARWRAREWDSSAGLVLGSFCRLGGDLQIPRQESPGALSYGSASHSGRGPLPTFRPAKKLTSSSTAHAGIEPEFNKSALARREAPGGTAAGCDGPLSRVHEARNSSCSGLIDQATQRGMARF